MDGGAGLPRLIELERHPRRSALPHDRLGRAQHDRGDGARGARDRGYEYLAITDHSATHGFGNDVSPEELSRQIERVREVDGRIEGIALLAGSEVNILPDGSLDYEDELLAELDWVIASVHTAFGMDEAGDDRADDSRDRAPAGGRDRPPDGED